MRSKISRQVKVYSKYRPGSGGWGGSEGKEVPWLNVSGVWLQEAGFKIGDRLHIRIENHTLIITNEDSHGDQSH